VCVLADPPPAQPTDGTITELSETPSSTNPPPPAPVQAAPKCKQEDGPKIDGKVTKVDVINVDETIKA
jgi:hypothetical protein